MQKLCLSMSTFYNSFPSSYSFVFQCSSSWEKNPCLVSKPHSTWMHASGFRARGSFYLRNLSRLIFFLLSSLSQKGRYLGKSREKVSVSNRDTLRADFIILQFPSFLALKSSIFFHLWKLFKITLPLALKGLKVEDIFEMNRDASLLLG